MSNTAFVFVKPHASANAAVVAYSKAFLAEHQVRVLSEGTLSPTGAIIDAHYSVLSRTAMDLSPADLGVGAEKKAEFEARFGVAWDQALADGTLCNYRYAQELLPDLPPPELERIWREESALRLGSGLYVGRLQISGSPTLHVINGFYGSMRHKYVREGAQIYWMVCEFDFPWKEFRGQVIGATDPAKAEPGSVRAKLLQDRETLGLGKVGLAFNGIHASAGPVEAARERAVHATVRGC